MLYIPVGRHSYRFLILTLALAFFSCSSDGAKEEQCPPPDSQKVFEGGTITLPLPDLPKTLDPILSQESTSTMIVSQIHEGLVRIDEQVRIVPGLAETWTVEDEGRSYIFRLRANARFHNGRPVTPGDVVYSIKRALAAKPRTFIHAYLLQIVGAKEFLAGKSETVPGLSVVGDNSVKIALVDPYAPFLAALGVYQASIIPENSDASIGAGPFMVCSIGQDCIELKRFKDYYGVCHLDAVRFKKYQGADVASAMQDFLENKLDITSVFGSVRDSLSGTSGVSLARRRGLWLFYYGVNCNHPKLKDPRVRRTLSKAIDRIELVRTVYKGQHEPARTILPPGMPGLGRDRANEVQPSTDKNLPYNLPRSVEIATSTLWSTVEDEINFVRQQFEKIGVRVTVKYIPDWREFISYIRSDKAELFRYEWTADFPDPDSMLSPLFSRDGQANFMRYNDRELESLLAAGRTTLDPTKRAEIYRQAENRILEAAPILPIYFGVIERACKSYVRDFAISPLGAHKTRLNGIWLELGKRSAITQ